MSHLIWIYTVDADLSQVMVKCSLWVKSFSILFFSLTDKDRSVYSLLILTILFAIKILLNILKRCSMGAFYLPILVHVRIMSLN